MKKLSTLIISLVLIGIAIPSTALADDSTVQPTSVAAKWTPERLIRGPQTIAMGVTAPVMGFLKGAVFNLLPFGKKRCQPTPLAIVTAPVGAVIGTVEGAALVGMGVLDTATLGIFNVAPDKHLTKGHYQICS